MARSGDEIRGDERGSCENNRTRTYRFGAGGHRPPAVGIARKGGHRPAGPDRVRRQLALELVDERANTGAGREEHGPVLIDPDLPALLRSTGGPQRPHHSWRAGGCDEVRRGRRERESIAVARVDAAEQGVDETLDDFAAEVTPNRVSHRRIVRGSRRAWPHLVERGTGHAQRREDPGPRQRDQLRWCSQDEAGRERSELAARPDPCFASGGGNEVVAEAELGGELDPSGHAGEERVRTAVDLVTGHRGAGDLPADGRVRFEDCDAERGLRSKDVPGGGQPGDATTNDDDVDDVNGVDLLVGRHGQRPCTISTTRVSTAGSVCGSTP